MFSKTRKNNRKWERIKRFVENERKTFAPLQKIKCRRDCESRRHFDSFSG
jgi:hypothetical protein